MHIKISKRTVDALKTTGKRYIAWDTEITGFGVRISPSGGKTYTFKYRVGGGRTGRVRWGTIGKHGTLTPDQARDVARDWAACIATGGDPAGDKLERRRNPTVSELLNEYLANHVERKNKASTVKEVRRLIEKEIRPALGHLKIADATTADIARFHAARADTPYQANRARAFLAKAFKLAETWGYRPRHSNPVSDVERYPERARERYLSAAEFAALGDSLARAERGELTLTENGRTRLLNVSRYQAAAIRLLVFTGARHGEILSLRWEWLDWTARRFNLPDSKGNRRKPIMLNAPALEVLRGLDMPKDGKGYVLRGGSYTDPEVPLENLKTPWGKVRKAAGIPDVRPHDLRHSFASVMAARGDSLPVIGALLGHRDQATTARYAHLSTDPLRAASDRAGGLIAGFMKGPGGSADVVQIDLKNRSSS
ncbi:tyrosine-type recombinase/integrase [Paracoccus onubensis]|uniref:DUF4102 domain-containing protein n=1 Tax=Paracoccus onubensis TaxID=1675788 RepID=A0A418SWX0_9RHOB|nr:site-specific integrase [Paracoccus onubensis]RJE85462.1 DUF4102 domain-containing protein [Paracoccus onubensis]